MAVPSNVLIPEDRSADVSLMRQTLPETTMSRAPSNGDELKRAEREILRRNEELAALSQIGQELTKLREPSEIAEVIYRVLGKVLNNQNLYVALYDEANQSISFPLYTIAGERRAVSGRAFGNGLTEHIIRTKVPVLIQHDLPAYLEEKGVALVGTPSCSYLGVPMIVGDQVLGVIAVQDYQRAAVYDESHAALLSTIASQAAIALENARLFAETQQRADQFAALYETARDLSTQQELSGLLYAIVESAAMLLNASNGGIYLYDAKRDELQVKVAQGTTAVVGTRLKMGEGMAGRVAQTRQPLIVDDYQTWEGRSLKFAGAPFRAVVEVPMLYGGELIGVLVVNEIGESTRKFTDADARLLSLFAAQAAGAARNARLLEETRRRAQQQEALYSVSMNFARAQTMQELCETVIRATRDLLGYQYLGVFLLDPQTGDRVLQAQFGWDEAPEMWRIPPGKGISEKAILTGELHYTPDVTQESRYIVGKAGSLSELDVPIKIGERVLGVLVAESNCVNGFDEGDFDLLQALASQLAVALENVRLLEETRRRFDEAQQRANELETLARVSASLGAASTRAEMLPVILDQSLDLMKGAGASLCIRDPATGEMVVELAIGNMAVTTGIRVPPGAGITGQIIATGAPYLNNDIRTDPRLFRPDLAGELRAVAAVPLISESQIIGALWIGREHPFAEDEVRLLTAIADVAGNAIHRATLHEQTESRLKQVQALHAIDSAINSSLDLRVTLNVLLSQTVSQLRVDAADVLLFRQQTVTLECAEGRGFRAAAFMQTRLRFGEDHAGAAALERRTLYVPDLRVNQVAPSRAPLLAGEGFISYVCAPIIAKGQIKGVLEVFHRAPLRPDKDWIELLETLAGQAAIAIENAELFRGLERSHSELSIAYDATIEGWSRALDLRDKETEGHTQRVTEITLRLSRAMGIGDAQLMHVHHGALLHDIGKMGIPDRILLKPGSLTDEEWQVMRKHPVYAHDLLSPIAYLRPALDIPYCHHEKWDGTGYPRGLKGEQIPLVARLFAVIDVWDALLSDRPYRPAWSKEQTLTYLREQRGKHFDPQAVDAFLQLLEKQ
jgi:HD-GYP domain-containing protein (c-di-GMP phosphodiesterase class II)